MKPTIPTSESLASDLPGGAPPENNRPDKNLIEHLVQEYGDLLYDLCASVLWSQANARVAFQSILREVQRGRSANLYSAYERSWVLNIACRKVLALAARKGRRLSSAEQVMLDGGLTSQGRLKQFDNYFHRLAAEDQVLLILKDKHGLPYSEISAAMQLPEGTLKTRRQQALRFLSELVWQDPSAPTGVAT